MQRLLKVLMLCSFCLSLNAAAADDALLLRNKYASLSEKLKTNQFNRPLYLESTESSTSLKGDIYALLDYPYATVNKALNEPTQGPQNWCDVLILHINTKYCHAVAGKNGTVLNMNIGKKTDQELSDAYRVQFNYNPVTSSSAATEYFQVGLSADSGPLGTKDYQIVVEAAAISGNRTFLHLTYAYSYGFAGRVAMKAYLATIGSDKVGFTTLNDEDKNYIGGVRGVVERNTFRYYLAIDAYLNALSATPDKRLEKRLNNWFNATEQFPRQLHEVDLNEYLDMKHKEIERQKTAQ